MVEKNKNASDEDQFDWVQFKKDYAVEHGETRKEKLVRKITENPLVPIGMEIHDFSINKNFLFHKSELGV